MEDHQQPPHLDENGQEYVIEGNYFPVSHENIEVELTEDSKGDFSYKEVSDMSDMTEESYPEGLAQTKQGAKDLENYERLLEQTKQKLKILDGIVQILIFS